MRKPKAFFRHTYLGPREWRDLLHPGERHRSQFDIVAIATSKADLAEHLTAILGATGSSEPMARDLKSATARSQEFPGNYGDALIAAVIDKGTAVYFHTNHPHVGDPVYRAEPDGTYTLAGHFRHPHREALPTFEPTRQ